MPGAPENFELNLDEVREVALFAIGCARPALPIFTRARPDDPRPSSALDLAKAFAEGARRTRALRDAAWASQHAAHDARAAGQPAASEAACAARAAAGAGFLHPLPSATQVKHILGAGAHAARALELAAGDPAVGDGHISSVRALASPTLVDVLRRYPVPAPDGNRVGKLVYELDAALR